MGKELVDMSRDHPEMMEDSCTRGCISISYLLKTVLIRAS